MTKGIEDGEKKKGGEKTRAVYGRGLFFTTLGQLTERGKR